MRAVHSLGKFPQLVGNVRVLSKQCLAQESEKRAFVIFGKSAGKHVQTIQYLHAPGVGVALRGYGNHLTHIKAERTHPSMCVGINEP